MVDRAWAHDLAAAHDAIAMVVAFDVGGTTHVCLVMKDGDTAPWFAAGKGIDGVAWTKVPGRDVIARILADPRVAGVRLSLNFCDARPLMFVYRDGAERIGGEELIGVKYDVLYPEAERRPALEEFFHCWGRP